MEIFAVTRGAFLWLLLGFALGTYAGVMVAPIATWWLARREWRQASREAELSPRAYKRTIVPQPQSSDAGGSEPRTDREPASV